MEVKKAAVAGTLESSDAMVRVTPADSLSVEIESVVIQQYGDMISCVVEQTLDRLSVTRGNIRVTDRGAIDCVLAARVETAILRAGDGNDFSQTGDLNS